MSRYQEIKDKSGALTAVIIADGSHALLPPGQRIPNAAGNRDWQEYQDWLSDGNTPDLAESYDHATEMNEERNRALKRLSGSGNVTACRPKWALLRI